MTTTNPTDHAPFLSKVRRLAGKVAFSRDLVALYYCMLDPRTPLGARAQIAATITYFVSPVDAVPDVMLPVPAGYVDDAAMVALTIMLIGTLLQPGHKEQADTFFDA